MAALALAAQLIPIAAGALSLTPAVVESVKAVKSLFTGDESPPQKVIEHTAAGPVNPRNVAAPTRNVGQVKKGVKRLRENIEQNPAESALNKVTKNKLQPVRGEELIDGASAFKTLPDDPDDTMPPDQQAWRMVEEAGMGARRSMYGSAGKINELRQRFGGGLAGDIGSVVMDRFVDHGGSMAEQRQELHHVANNYSSAAASAFMDRNYVDEKYVLLRGRVPAQTIMRQSIVDDMYDENASRPQSDMVRSVQGYMYEN